MSHGLTEGLGNLYADLKRNGHGSGARMVDKANNHMAMARRDLRQFIDDRELSPDAVEDLEDIIKCLE